MIATVAALSAGTVWAADNTKDPDAPFTAPAPAPAQTTPTAGPSVPEVPAGPVYVPGSGPVEVAKPRATLAAMADEVEKRGDTAAAVVGGHNITEAEVADVMRTLPAALVIGGSTRVYRQALEQLIRQKLLVVAAEKAGLDKDAGVRRRMHRAAERDLGEEWLARTVNEVVTEQAVHARYDRDVAGHAGPTEVSARIILLPSETEALSAIIQLQAGADFAEMAKARSKDASAAAGGDLGYQQREALTPEIAAAIFALNPGQITASPIAAPTGYVIARVEGRRQRATPTYEEARGRLVVQLRYEASIPIIRGLMAQVKPAQNPPAR